MGELRTQKRLIDSNFLQKLYLFHIKFMKNKIVKGKEARFVSLEIGKENQCP